MSNDSNTTEILEINDAFRGNTQYSLSKNNQDIEFDEDEDILNELENGDIPAHIREARLNELTMKAIENQFVQKNSAASYRELSEDEFLQVTTSNKKCVVHFYHNDFKRCEIMHSHLQKLALSHMNVVFAKINVEKAKFFVKKLAIQTLPAVLCFKDGIIVHKIIGFEQMANQDNFETRVLEKILCKIEILQVNQVGDISSGNESEEEEVEKKSIFRQTVRNENSDDSD